MCMSVMQYTPGIQPTYNGKYNFPNGTLHKHGMMIDHRASGTVDFTLPSKSHCSLDTARLHRHDVFSHIFGNGQAETHAVETSDDSKLHSPGFVDLIWSLLGNTKRNGVSPLSRECVRS